MIKIISRGGILLLPLFLLIFSCTEDAITTGIELLPDSDRLDASADTIPIECFTYKGFFTNVSLTDASSDNCPIGQVFDPIFGETVSEVAMELLFSTSNYYKRSSEDNNDHPVSLKLYLNIDDFEPFGDEEAIDISVFTLKSRFNYNLSNNGGVVSDMYDHTDNKAVSIKFDQDKIKDKKIYSIPDLDTNSTYMVVELDTSFARYLMDTNIYTTSAFYEALPGLVLRPSVKFGKGALQTILPKKSLLVLEYERPGGGSEGNDTTYFSNYSIKDYHCNYRFVHESRGAEIEDAFRDTVNQAEKFYLQGLGGTRGIIKLDALKEFKEANASKIGLNYAELVFPISEEHLSDTATFNLPRRIFARSITNNDLPDDGISASYFDGYLNPEKLEYRLNISEYVHFYLRGDLNLVSLNLFTSKFTFGTDAEFDTRTLNRVILESGNSTDRKAFLRLIYTNLDH